MNDILWEERMTLLPSQCLPPSLPHLKSRGSWRGGGVEGGGGGEQRYKDDDALVAGGGREPRESRDGGGQGCRVETAAFLETKEPFKVT